LRLVPPGKRINTSIFEEKRGKKTIPLGFGTINLFSNQGTSGRNYNIVLQNKSKSYLCPGISFRDPLLDIPCN